MPSSWLSESHSWQSCKSQFRREAPLLASDLFTGCNTRFGGTGSLHLVRVKMSSFSAKVGDQNQTFQSRLLLLNVAAWMCSMTKMDTGRGHSGMTVGGDLLVFNFTASTLNSSRTFPGMISCFLTEIWYFLIILIIDRVSSCIFTVGDMIKPPLTSSHV